MSIFEWNGLTGQKSTYFSRVSQPNDFGSKFNWCYNFGHVICWRDEKTRAGVRF